MQARPAARTPRRVGVLSVHTSPLDQPGTGDAGGMNVYVLETAKRLADAGVEVEVFTRAVSSDTPPTVHVNDGVRVHHLRAGPFEALRKEDLPAQLCALSVGLLQEEAAHPEGWFDLLHSHYWLSGQVGWLASQRWQVPLVHSMHTMAKVKNTELAAGDTPEPRSRIIGEEQVVAASERLLANTADEAQDLINLYSADRERVDVVHPGVDLDTFRPATPDDRARARVELGIEPDAICLLFVGRIQPLKAPDLLITAVAEVLRRYPHAPIVVAINGGPSGSGLEHPTALADLAGALQISDLVRFEPPVGRARLAQWYQAADWTVVPSHSESFGLVAVESQACGTPVIAADVGGLRTAVADGRSGILVTGHDPQVWARELADHALNPVRREELAAGARRHAEQFSWSATAAGLLSSYRRALHARPALRLAASDA
jgi:D-inositol-3-phosphate glycosyltransferase